MIIVSYIVKVQIVFTILFAVYYLFLRKEKFLVLNRFILVGIIASAFILPVSRTFNINCVIKQQQATIVNTLPKFLANNQPTSNLLHISTPVQVDGVTLAMAIYILVTTILLIPLLINLVKVFNAIRLSRRHKTNGITYCEPLDEIPPFSFFNFIVVSKSAFNSEEYSQIITHESVHSRQLHSFDVLLADMACILLWINPLIYLYRRELKLNLEFLADEATLSAGIDACDYQLNLLQHSGMLTANLPVNAFLTSKIKERIVMINTERPKISNCYKYLVLTPVALALSVLVGFKQERTVFIGKDGWSLNMTVDTRKPVGNRQPVFLNSQKRDKDLNHKPIIPGTKKLKLQQRGSTVAIDARTDTVKFSLVPDSMGRKFKGIYVIDDKIFSDDEIQAAMKPTGRLQMILANRPIIGMYTANDSNAIKKWGKQARPGVIFVTTRQEKPN